MNAIERVEFAINKLITFGFCTDPQKWQKQSLYISFHVLYFVSLFQHFFIFSTELCYGIFQKAALKVNVKQCHFSLRKLYRAENFLPT